jgi:aspartyl-tRNA(Asn)/glutamyl-tRNA(Gln) amidotransferase subunit A
VARLQAAGAVIVGKCNLHEFAFGTTNEDSAWGPARHPLDPSRSPGGSSGGSAVAVATGASLASIGTDTGGSIRIPSAACGLVGLKATWGSVPLQGVVPLAASLDHVGPLTRSVDDAAIVFDALRGYPHHTEQPLGHDLAPAALRIGVPRAYFFDVLDDEVRAAIEQAIARLREAGATLETVELPHAPLTAPVYLATVLAEAAAYHAATLERRPDAYTPPVRMRLEMCRYVTGEDYLRAQAGRRVLRAEVEAALRGRHALLLPTLPIVAPPLGQATVRVGSADESVRTVTLRLTQLFNLTGHPAISVPCGTGATGLPVGAQFVGRLRQTRDLLRVAACCENVWR